MFLGCLFFVPVLLDVVYSKCLCSHQQLSVLFLKHQLLLEYFYCLHFPYSQYFILQTIIEDNFRIKQAYCIYQKTLIIAFSLHRRHCSVSQYHYFCSIVFCYFTCLYRQILKYFICAWLRTFLVYGNTMFIIS